MTVNTSITTDWFTFFIALLFSNLTFLMLVVNFSNLSIQYVDVSYNIFYSDFFSIFLVFLIFITH